MSSGLKSQTGARVSTTFTVTNMESAFPETSEMMYVRATVDAPSQEPGVMTSFTTTKTLSEQASMASTGKGLRSSPHCRVSSLHVVTNEGGVVSTTVTIWVVSVSLPHASVAVNVRITL